MTAIPSPSRRRSARVLPLVCCAVLVAAAAGAQLPGLIGAQAPAADAWLDEPLLEAPPAEEAGGDAAVAVSTSGGYDAAAELVRVRADVDFWASKLDANPLDIVAALKLAESHVALARMTGDAA